MALSNNLILLGIILIFLGFIMIITSSLMQLKINAKSASIVFIGPFPIFGYAQNKVIFYILVILTILTL